MLRCYTSDHFVLPLPPGHRFPMTKYALLRERAAASGFAELVEPPATTDAQILRAHDLDYVQRMVNGQMTDREMRRIGFPWSPAIVERSRRASGATLAACQHALSGAGVAANLAGGTHHAYADHGEGYCVFNDSIIAARAMQDAARATRVVVIDCDVHQGNGTAVIAAGDETIFTFSIHGAKNFPFHKEQSDLDIALDDDTGDAVYLAVLDEGLAQAIERSRADLAIYLAGADPHERDRLGRLKLTKAGLAARDQLVFGTCARAGLPVAVTMAGGYGVDVNDIVDIHLETLRIAARR